MTEQAINLDQLNKNEREAVEGIHTALVGKTNEEACAILCAVCALQGFYNQAIQFAERAQVLREMVVKPDLATREDSRPLFVKRS